MEIRVFWSTEVGIDLEVKVNIPVIKEAIDQIKEVLKDFPPTKEKS